MTRRYPGQPPKTVPLNIRVTPEVADRIKGLAAYLRKPYAVLLADLAEEKRQALVAEGKRPPLRAPDSLVLNDSGPNTPSRRQ